MQINNRHQLAVGYLFFVNGVVFAAWATNIPEIKTYFDLTKADVGFVLLVMACGAVSFMTLSGYLVCRFGSNLISKMSSIGFAATLPMIFWADNYATLIFAVAIFGAANGAMDVSMNEQASRLEQLMGRHTMSRSHACFSIGALAGSLLTFIALANGVTPFAQAIGLFMFILATALWAFGHLLGDFSTQPSNSEKISASSFLGNKMLIVLGLLSFITMLSEGGIADWSAIYLIEFSNVTAYQASLGYAAYALLMIVGRVSGDKLISVFNYRLVVGLSGLLCASGMATVLLAGSFVVQLTGFAVLGLGQANLVPIIFSNAGKLSGQTPGAGIAVVSVFGYSGFLFGPVIIGNIAQIWGLDHALVIVVIVGVIMLMASPFFAGRAAKSGHVEPT